MNLAGRIILVTGAGSGMGRATTELATERGATVFATDISEKSLEELSSQLGGLAYQVSDLTKSSAAESVVSACINELGGLDGVVNAAGIFQTRSMLDVTEEDLDNMFAVNFRALYFVQQAAAKVMSGGSIVNFASTAARVPRPISSHYAASKAAVVSASRSAASAWAARGIRVNSVSPGVIETPMIDRILVEQAERAGVTERELLATWQSMNPMGRLGRPREVAELVVFLLSDAASYITGESIAVNGGADDI